MIHKARPRKETAPLTPREKAFARALMAAVRAVKERTDRRAMRDALEKGNVEEALTLIGTHFRPRMGVLPLFSDAELRRLQMPVLLLVGDRDVLRDGKRIAARLQTLLPHLSATILPGAGHALLNTPAHVLPFLAAQSPAAQ